MPFITSGKTAGDIKRKKAAPPRGRGSYVASPEELKLIEEGVREIEEGKGVPLEKAKKKFGL